MAHKRLQAILLFITIMAIVGTVSLVILNVKLAEANSHAMHFQDSLQNGTIPKTNVQYVDLLLSLKLPSSVTKNVLAVS